MNKKLAKVLFDLKYTFYQVYPAFPVCPPPSEPGYEGWWQGVEYLCTKHRVDQSGRTICKGAHHNLVKRKQPYIPGILQCLWKEYMEVKSG